MSAGSRYPFLIRICYYALIVSLETSERAKLGRGKWEQVQESGIQLQLSAVSSGYRCLSYHTYSL